MIRTQFGPNNLMVPSRGNLRSHRWATKRLTTSTRCSRRHRTADGAASAVGVAVRRRWHRQKAVFKALSTVLVVLDCSGIIEKSKNSLTSLIELASDPYFKGD